MSYQAKKNKRLFAIEDYKLGSHRYHIEEAEESHIIDGLQHLMNLPLNGLGYLMYIINSIRLFETGYYSQSVAMVIDAFHYYLDYLIETYIDNTSFKQNIDESPAKFDSKDKTTWIFEMLCGKNLRDFLGSLSEMKVDTIISKDRLWENYSRFRDMRNKIVHPRKNRQIDVTHRDAFEACATVKDIINLVRKGFERDNNLDIIFISLHTFFYK